MFDLPLSQLRRKSSKLGPSLVTFVYSRFVSKTLLWYDRASSNHVGNYNVIFTALFTKCYELNTQQPSTTKPFRAP